MVDEEKGEVVNNQQTEIEGDRKVRIEALEQKNREAFEAWVEENKGKPRLSLTSEAARYLIPRRLLELVDNPEELEVKLGQSCDTGLLDASIVRRSEKPITNVENILKREKLRYQLAAKNRIDLLSPLPPGEDEFHHTLSEKYESGDLDEKDFVYLDLYMSKLGKQELNVTTYSDREELQGKGIAISFYTRLREVASRIGFRYITGEQHSERPLNFFINKLGRVRLPDAPPDVRQEIVRAHKSIENTIENENNFTVDILPSQVIPSQQTV